MISVAILTKDEAADLPGCLQSLDWCDDIHVLDSGSSDETLAIARAAGAQIYEHPFSSFGEQRNWLLIHGNFRYSWVLFLDADERSTAAFAQSGLKAVNTAPESVAGFYCCWKTMLQGRWLKRCDSFPKWQFRLLRHGRATFLDDGHGQKEGQINGTIAYLREPYLHFAFSKGWSRWLNRHNHYSDLEAKLRLGAELRWKEMLSGHGAIRNKALKPLVSRLPGWPIVTFIIRYFLKLGFLEGRAGLLYCVNMAYYEFLIRIKMQEQAALSDPPRKKGEVESPARPLN